MTLVDAHVHVWDLAHRPQPWIDPTTMAVLHRDHVLADLEKELAAADASGAVLVQVLNDGDETAEYLELAAAESLLGVVGWVDLLASDLAERLDVLQAHASGSKLVGIRHQALAEPEPAEWLARAGELRGLATLGRRGLAFDLMLRPEHLDVAHAVVRAHPSTAFVLDHAGKAPILRGWRSDPSRHWARVTRRLAELPNLVCKLSGLTTMAHHTAWTVGDLRPYVDHLLDCFGADRLLFGSDWPVSLRAGDYARTVGAARTLLSHLSASEQAAVLSGTVTRVYGLAVPSAAGR